MEEVGSAAPSRTDRLEMKSLFAELVHTHAKELLRFARRRLNDPLAAEDMVQTTFLAAWQARDRFAADSSPRTWLFSILKNKLADHYRQAYRDPVIHGGSEPDDERFDADGQWRPEHRPQPWHADEADNAEALQKFLAVCLERLPAHWRAAVEMKYLHDRDAGAICQELGITPTNYWQQLHRAKLKLRECISKQLAAHQ